MENSTNNSDPLKEEYQAVNILLDMKPMFKKKMLNDVHTAGIPISGCHWIDTSDGIVLIDTLLTQATARPVLAKIKELGKKIKYIIYTHGHRDHVGGASIFQADNPEIEIIASKYLPTRLDKYTILEKLEMRKRSQQFNIPEVKIAGDFVYPTKTFLGDMTFSLGDKTFELHTARAETDDVVWVYVPELKAAFIGDLIIGSFPNIGNPWKPTRFALDWAVELERIRAIEPEYIFSGGQLGISYKGNNVNKVLDANIEVIRSLHDQTVDLINQGMHITEMIHAVKIPDHLKKSRFLKQSYSRTEFFVYNVYRWYHGYFDENPANMFPRPEKEVNNEIFSLIGDTNKIFDHVKGLLDQDQAQLALQILDILIQAEPENIEALKLRIKLLKKLGEDDSCLMSRNSWYYFMQKDKKNIRLLKRKNR
ncbi:MAG: MBL fold metallo-hydrolase [archaeon]|nr:MBL fold metallo-hydrolase [archaeon]